ncbi:DUF1120 domain-containing protein [Pseudomonas sp. 18.1.10]|uniref:DUF1120 domain-containing protein n=1 Tax=Pseudomonas sp. 18.1.10 TaxID=2969302 RepID=UPI00214F7ADC|nr:DUF1120 domain-containing protein [Pseudomonas sp. 18.1.10]MCR4539240.1 DUF1120 domain-containing protein [Pseudomonas sp. 18.1.10]
MKCFLIALSALSLLVGGPSARANSSVNLSATGKITPSACEPRLSNGGEYDLGKIPAKDLNLDQPTALPVQTLQLELTCEALTLVALKPRDNRSGSSSDSQYTFRFGLGRVNGNEKVGSMVLDLQSILADGNPMYAIGSEGPTGWAPTDIISPTFITSFTSSRSIPNLAPMPIQRLTADLRIAPRIAPANTLTLTKEVPIDGSVTLEINYL